MMTCAMTNDALLIHIVLRRSSAPYVSHSAAPDITWRVPKGLIPWVVSCLTVRHTCGHTKARLMAMHQ